MKKAFKLFFLLTFLSAHIAWAAPKQIILSYQASRNGKPFANVVERFEQANGQYKIESVTEGVGLAALLGKRVLRSEGLVTDEGLQPKHFEQHQGDNETKSVYADFDWTANQLSLKNKGNIKTEALLESTQDLLSFSYQWIYTSLKDEQFSLPVTTGKKLRVYRYAVTEQDVNLVTEAGQFKTVHLVSTVADAKGNEKEFWLAKDHYYLPVKIVQRDENGSVIEQTLTTMQVNE